MINNNKHLIAVVDDEEKMLNAVRRQLEDSYDVRTFNSANELLASIDTINPSLFIIDWMMPEKDGISLCRDIRKKHKYDLIPITFYTGVDPSQENIKDSFEAGAQSFISKTVSTSFMLIQINTLINSYERLLHYLSQQKTMLSVLKHDMSNLLTGVTTGLRIMMMDETFKKAELREEADMILDAEKNLRTLFGDLSEVLVTDNGSVTSNIFTVKSSEVAEDLKSYVKHIQRKIQIKIADGIEIPCDRHLLGRAIYYIVKFIDRHMPRNISVDISAVKEDAGAVFLISLNGTLKECLEKAVFNALDSSEDSERYNIMYIQYFQSFLNRNRTSFEILEENGRTELRFVLNPV